MNIFDLIVVQPIFNLLALIYGLLPGSDFGIALIIFTIVVRLLMWPLIKKQLHQTKVQRAIQPELKKIRKQANGNKQLEGQMMLELYRELADTARAFAGWRIGILTASPLIERAFGPRPAVKKPLANGPLRSYFYLYTL